MGKVTITLEVDEDTLAQATAAVALRGVTVQDAIAAHLTDIALDAMDLATPDLPDCTPEEYDAWFRAQVEEAMNDTSSGIPHADVVRHFEYLMSDRRRIGNAD